MYLNLSVSLVRLYPCCYVCCFYCHISFTILIANMVTHCIALRNTMFCFARNYKACYTDIFHAYTDIYTDIHFVCSFLHCICSHINHFAHLESILVEQGQDVSIETQIGTVGSTGMSTGPHLHLEMTYNDELIDPSPFIFNPDSDTAPAN